MHSRQSSLVFIKRTVSSSDRRSCTVSQGEKIGPDLIYCHMYLKRAIGRYLIPESLARLSLIIKMAVDTPPHIMKIGIRREIYARSRDPKATQLRT
jgi:hypothetical protein